MKQPKKILIIEDEPDLREAYRTILDSVGYEVATSTNGMQGMKELREFQPDIVILDLLMPEMDGMTFLENFDAERYPDVRIVVCSNLFDETTRQRAIELGAVDILLKSSMSPGDLVGHIKTL